MHPPSTQRAPELFWGSTCYTFAPDVWSFGCIVGEIVLGGARLFDSNGFARAVYEEGEVSPREATTPAETDHRQIHLLLCLFGTPSQAEITAMNPDLVANTSSVRWMRLPPQPPRLDWQSLLRIQIGDDSDVHTSEVLELLTATFHWNPHLRPCAQALLSLQFLRN